MQTFKNHGKLLLTGEYVVLDGASALALPTSYAQTLKAEKIPQPEIRWTGFDELSQVWLKVKFSLSEIKKDSSVLQSEDPKERLLSVLRVINKLNPAAFAAENGWRIETHTDFPLEWGLGSSSTLIANLSKLYHVDPFELLTKTFGGSGYDVAVALQERPLIYQLQEQNRSLFSTSFDPPFKDQLFFVYLNRKQNSRDAISHYRNLNKDRVEVAVEKISSLTQKIITCTSLSEFNMLLEIHENIISQLIDLPKIQTLLFLDFKGQVKSLGGWGGDFVLATGRAEDMEYFRQKGYSTIIPYPKMILK